MKYRRHDPRGRGPHASRQTQQGRRRASRDASREVEALNPGGSVKDRVGLAMIEDAERAGLLRPGGTIIEATAGNTGVGLALAAAVKGYRCIFVLPDKMSEDKINLLRAYGAEVVITPTSVPPDSPESYNGVADRLAQRDPRAYRPNQFANPQESRGPLPHHGARGSGTTRRHASTSSWRAWARAARSRDGPLPQGAEPGCTCSGRRPRRIDPVRRPPRPYLVEGIGEDFVPATFDRQVVDEFVRVSDAESFAAADDWPVRRACSSAAPRERPSRQPSGTPNDSHRRRSGCDAPRHRPQLPEQVLLGRVDGIARASGRD